MFEHSFGICFDAGSHLIIHALEAGHQTSDVPPIEVFKRQRLGSIDCGCLALDFVFQTVFAKVNQNLESLPLTVGNSMILERGKFRLYGGAFRNQFDPVIAPGFVGEPVYFICADAADMPFPSPRFFVINIELPVMGRMRVLPIVDTRDDSFR